MSSQTMILATLSDRYHRSPLNLYQWLINYQFSNWDCLHHLSCLPIFSRRMLMEVEGFCLPIVPIYTRVTSRISDLISNNLQFKCLNISLAKSCSCTKLQNHNTDYHMVKMILWGVTSLVVITNYHTNKEIWSSD